MASLEAAPDAALALTPDHARHLGRGAGGPAGARPERAAAGGARCWTASSRRRAAGAAAGAAATLLDDRVRADLAPLFAAAARGDAMPAAAGPAASADRGAGRGPGRRRGVGRRREWQQRRARLRRGAGPWRTATDTGVAGGVAVAGGAVGAAGAVHAGAAEASGSGDAGAASGAALGHRRCRRCRRRGWCRCPAGRTGRRGFAAALGWVAAGPVLLRLDVAEQVAGELGWATRDGPRAVPAGLASRLSIKPDLLPVALRALGFRVVPGVGTGAGGVSALRRPRCCCRCGGGGLLPPRQECRSARARAVRRAGGAEAVGDGGPCPKLRARRARATHCSGEPRDSCCFVERFAPIQHRTIGCAAIALRAGRIHPAPPGGTNRFTATSLARWRMV